MNGNNLLKIAMGNDDVQVMIDNQIIPKPQVAELPPTKWGRGLTNMKDGPKGSKWRNNVTKDEKGKIIWHSDKERNRYPILMEFQAAGIISGLVHEKDKVLNFQLQEGFRDKAGKWHRPIHYQPDFEYWFHDESGLTIKIFEDIKGTKTPGFRIKEKMFRYQRPELNLWVNYDKRAIPTLTTFSIEPNAIEE